MISKHGFKTTEARSELMSKIKSKDTKPEILLRKELKRAGLKFSIHSKSLPGNPDIVFRKQKLIVFIDGEFWHGYKWKNKKPKIKANREYWIKKIEGNIRRDKRNNKELEKLGYLVQRFWEKQILGDIEVCLILIFMMLQEINE
ncbi:MAG: very short patch repair endonuclease [Bacteroidia bacterium]